jgi:phosphohistidine swiveling domain-containing protein
MFPTRLEQTVALADLDAGALPTVGGKAANLGELIRAGLPVPDGFAVTTEAYRRVAGELVADLAGADGADLAAKARGTLLAAPVPEDVATEIREAYQRLGADVPVAVRSSATAEDLPYASFAGQQDTYLHIVGADAVVDAVRRCWASLWTERAVSYRTANGIDHGQVLIAVVVQRMVEAEVAGVLFTANPVTGRRRQAVIDASPGLGESVVSGAVNPDRFTVDTDGGAIVDRRLGDKRRRVRPLPGGGTETVELPDGSGAACLSDDQVTRLVAMGARVEQHFGRPQDIEWAIDTGGALWLTQARPITTLFPLPAGAPADPDDLRAYFNVNVAQGMYRPFTPMGRAAFRLVGAGVADLIGRPVPDRRAGPAVLQEAAGRLFVDVTEAIRSRAGREVMPRILGVMEARSADMVRTLFADPRMAVRHGAGPALRVIGRAALRFRAPQQIARVYTRPAAVPAYIAGLQRQLTAGLALPADASPVEHLRLAERLLVERMPRVMPSLLPTLLAATGAFVLAGKLQPGADPALRQAVLRAMPHNVTTEMDLELWDLARTIRADTAAAGEFRDATPAELAARYRAGTLAGTTQRGLAAFLSKYGHRAVAEIDLGMPRWSDDPTHIIGVLANYLRPADPGQAPDVQFARAAAEAHAAVDELTAQARRRGRIRGAVVGFGLRRSRQVIGLRESPKFLLVIALGVAREHIAVVGRALTERGLLEAADDVFFLDFTEAEAALAGRDFRAVVTARRLDYEREVRRRTLPHVLLSDGTEPATGTGRADLPPGAMAGTPASAGTVTAPARVVLDPVGAHLEPGEILVAPSTDPGWTPLFLTAGGLVMEMGGANSHGAMVAREYGIPAVVGVPGATTGIGNGDTITVDGAAGTVLIGG